MIADSPPAPTIFYDHVDTPVGTLLLAATDRPTLVAILFPNDPDPKGLRLPNHRHDPSSLHEALPTSLRSARLRHQPTILEPVRIWLLRYFNTEPVGLSDLGMPLELLGTEFMKSVWIELTKIPYGRTASYGDVAKAIGQPGASRAVGLANNRNPIPIVVPCHRVIGSDGKMVGYAGGLWRKNALLQLEQGGQLFAPGTFEGSA